MGMGKGEAKMNRVEVKGNIAQDGSVILPPGVLETIGAKPGDCVQIAYVSERPVHAENSYGELFLSPAGIWKMECREPAEEAQMKIPHELLEEAGIPLDAELAVQTVPGVILIGEKEPLVIVKNPFYGMLKLLEMSEKEAMEILRKGGFLDE